MSFLITPLLEIGEEWPSELRCCYENWKVPGSNPTTPLGTWPGIGTQPHYEAPGNLQVEYVKMQ